MEIILMRILSVIILMLVFCKYAGDTNIIYIEGEDVDSLLDRMYPVLCEMESSGRADAIGDNGKAFGILQIHKAVVKDVNRFCDTDYHHNEMFDPRYAREVYEAYLKKGVELYKNKMKTTPKEQDIVRMWNGGIYEGYSIFATVKYYIKYIEVKRMLQGEDVDHSFQNEVAKKIRGVRG